MKKTLAIVAIIAIISGYGMIAFSESKRPMDMNKTEKIQKKIKEAKKEELKKAKEQINEASQAQPLN